MAAVGQSFEDQPISLRAERDRHGTGHLLCTQREAIGHALARLQHDCKTQVGIRRDVDRRDVCPRDDEPPCRV